MAIFLNFNIGSQKVKPPFSPVACTTKTSAGFVLAIATMTHTDRQVHSQRPHWLHHQIEHVAHQQDAAANNCDEYRYEGVF